jgi:hypothetical protein
VYLLSLSLENVRCFGPKQFLDLSNGRGQPASWTVILGNNGVGKTTLLRSITAIEPVPFNLSKGGTYYPRGFVEDLFSSRASWRPARKGTRRTEISAKVLSGSLMREQAGRPLRTTIELAMEEQDEMAEANPITPAFRGLVCYGYGASRRMGAGFLSASNEVGPSDSLFSEQVPLRNAEEWLLQADYGASKESPAQEAAKAKRDSIKQLLLDLLPEVDDLRFTPPAQHGTAARVELKTPYGWMAMNELSLGYRTLIAWMVDLASRLYDRYPDSTNPLAEPAVVLVDEIDLHLHPKWQRQLIGYLTERFPNTQFIVTAHSPLVVQSATDANIVILKREDDHVVIDNDVESIRGWRVDQILTSDLFGLETARPPQIEQLLKERTALLARPRLTPRDKARLRELEAAIGPLPTGETKTEREALALIQRAAERLRDGRK